jgi:hypothetical protein
MTAALPPGRRHEAGTAGAGRAGAPLKPYRKPALIGWGTFSPLGRRRLQPNRTDNPPPYARKGTRATRVHSHIP